MTDLFALFPLDEFRQFPLIEFRQLHSDLLQIALFNNNYFLINLN